MRARALGIEVGTGVPGPGDAITDVDGVRVGHTTLIEGGGPLVVGQGPVRTGVTVILPHGGDIWTEPLFAGCHRLNGNGELTGLEWVRESGLLTSPIALTNTHNVGVVRDALIAHEVAARDGDEVLWGLPVVGETWDGVLNDINGFHVRAEHVAEAVGAATAGPVPEGSVGGGTGMISHAFKGGVGTASRVLPPDLGGFTVGVLVQANHGRRERFQVNGVPVGMVLSRDEVPAPRRPVPPRAAPPDGAGSIIVVAATDAPLLPNQCERLAQRAGLGVARTGGVGGAHQRRPVHRLRHGQPRHDGGVARRLRAAHRAAADAVERLHHAAVRRRGRGDRGGHPQRDPPGRHHGGPRRHHRPRPRR